MENTRYTVPRTAWITDPETGKRVRITHDVIVTHRKAPLYVGDVVRRVDKQTGEKVLDYSALTDVLGDGPDVPPNVELIVMACDITAPMLPVMCNHPELKDANASGRDGLEIRGLWISRDNVKYVDGPNRHAFAVASFPIEEDEGI